MEQNQVENDYVEQTVNNQTPPKRSKKWWVVLIIVIIIIAIGGGYYYWNWNNQETRSKLQTNSNDQASNDKTAVSIPDNSTAVSNSNVTATTGAFFAESDGKETTYYKTDLNSNKTKLFSYKHGDMGEYGPHGQLSPDRNFIYYSEKGDLKSFNIDTSEIKIIKKGNPYIDGMNAGDVFSFYDIKVSPDGKKIAFTWVGWEIRGFGVINTDGTNFKNNIFCGTSDSINWSRDSQKIVVSGGNNDFGGEHACIDKYDNNFENKLGLLKKIDGKTYPDEYKDSGNANFSPNGNRVVFDYRYLDYGENRNDAENAERYRGIYVVDSDGANFNQVSENMSFSTNPLWINNNTIIYGLSNYYIGNSEKGIYTVNVNKSNNIQIYSSSENYYEPVSLSLDGNYLIFKTGKKDKSTSATVFNGLKLLNMTTKQIIELSSQQSSVMVGWSN